MKRKFFAAALAALMLMACGEGAAETETVPETTAGTSAETTQTESETTAVTEAETTAPETTTETAETVPEREYARVSEGNVFIDYDFIEDCLPTDIGELGTLGAKAAAFLSESEYYAESAENTVIDIDINKVLDEMLFFGLRHEDG